MLKHVLPVGNVKRIALLLDSMIATFTKDSITVCFTGTLFYLYPFRFTYIP